MEACERKFIPRLGCKFFHGSQADAGLGVEQLLLEAELEQMDTCLLHLKCSSGTCCRLTPRQHAHP